MESRRKFLTTIITVEYPLGSSLSRLARRFAPSARKTRTTEGKEDDSHMPKFDPKLILAANQRKLRKCREALRSR